MSRPLAIFTPRVGAASETFIRRHVEHLLPGGTVAVTNVLEPLDGRWNNDVPVRELGRLRPGLMQRGLRALAREMAWPIDSAARAAARRFLRQHQVQVVMGEYLDVSIEWLGLARELGIRFFAHAHGYDVSSRLRDPQWQAAYLRYNDGNGVITMSRISRDRLVALGLDSSKVHVVPYGVDVPHAPPARPARDDVRCLTVGRMVAKKSPVVALDAFRRALEAHPNMHLDMVGTGPLLPAAEQFVRAFRLESHVTLHGEQGNDVVQSLMRRADIFVQHSVTADDGNEEGLPVAILEAMASALPVVATRHAGIPEAVEDGLTGSLVEEGDSAGMADRIADLASNGRRRNAMGRAGWARAAERFDWRIERAALLDVLGLSA